MKKRRIYKRYRKGKKKGGQHYWVGRKPRHYGSKLFREKIEEKLPPIKVFPGSTLKKKELIHFFEKNPEYLEKTRGLEEIWLGRTTSTPKERIPVSQFISPPESDKIRIEFVGKHKIQKLFFPTELVHELKHLKQEETESRLGIPHKSTAGLPPPEWAQDPAEKEAIEAEREFALKKYGIKKYPWRTIMHKKPKVIPPYFFEEEKDEKEKNLD